MAGIPDLIPDPGTFCVNVVTAPGEVCIQFPGGATLCATAGFETGDLAQIISSLLASANAALAPLNPLLDIFDVLKAVFDCIQAIPQCLAPPSPVPIINCIKGLAQAIDKILKLIPPFPILVMVKNIIEALALGLQGIRNRLAALIAQADKVLRAGTRAAQLGGGIGLKLQGIASCASSNLDAQFQNLNAGMAPLNRLIGVINVLLELVGQPCIPVMGIPSEVSNAALKPLDVTIEVLQTIAALIPGGISIPILPPAGSC